jgi:hypothetical protein
VCEQASAGQATHITPATLFARSVKADATGPNVRFLSLIRATGRGLIGSLEHFTIRLTLPVSLPGLTGQSSSHGRCLLDRPVKPGDDSRVGANLIEKCSRASGKDIRRHSRHPACPLYQGIRRLARPSPLYAGQGENLPGWQTLLRQT